MREEPCVDWWEEREGVHAATLACIAAGLGDDLDLSRAEERLDGSLLVLPFLGFGPVDVTPLVGPGGGVHRHLDDTYYGGGEWLLLTALLGLAEPEHGEERAGVDRGAAPPTTAACPSSRTTTSSTPSSTTPGSAKWGPPPSPAALVARDVPDARPTSSTEADCPPACS